MGGAFECIDGALNGVIASDPLSKDGITLMVCGWL